MITSHEFLNEQMLKIDAEFGDSSISVKEVLEIPVFKGYKIIAGHKGIEKMCKHVTILETPEGIEWLRGEEFLLTTGYVYKDNPEAYKNLIYLLHSQNISAIGIKEHRYISSLPKELIEQADKYELPVIILPYSLIYTDAVSEFYERLFYSKNKYILELRDMYEKLSHLISNSKDVQQVTDVLSLLTNSTVIVLNTEYNVISININNPCHEAVYEELMSALKSNQSIPSKIDNYFINIYKIDSDNKTTGYIYAISKSPENALTNSVMQYGRFIMHLKIAKEKNDYLNQLKIKKSITEIIMNKNDLSDDFYSNIKYAYNWKANENFVGICIHINDKDLKKCTVTGLKEQLYTIVTRFLNEKGFLTTESSENIFLFCPADDAVIKELINKITAFQHEYINKITLKYGVSQKYPHIKYISEMYDESLIAMLFSNVNGLYSYESMDILKILYLLKDEKQIYNFYQNTICKIEKYDTESKSNLIDTLKAYFEYNMNKKLVSEKLFIHPETLRYRLNKIEQITGYSLNTSEGMLTLQIGLYLSQIINIKQHSLSAGSCSTKVPE